MSALLALPVLLPLVGAALSIMLGRSRVAQRIVALVVLTTVTCLAVALLVAVDRDGLVVTQAGDWYAPVGITLVADRFSAVMLLTAAGALLAVDIYATPPASAEKST